MTCGGGVDLRNLGTRCAILLLRSDDGSYRYDLNGNLERGPHTTLAYAANQTTRVQISTGSPAGEQLDYRGDGQGDLAREGWDLVRTSVLGLASRGNSYYARAVDGTLLSERTPRGRFNYLYDGYGSVAGLADGGGRLTSTYLYDAYGHPVADFGYYRDNDNPFGWRGAYGVGAGEWGVFCGPLNAIGGRYYDPEAGSFTQPAFTLAQAVKAVDEGVDGGSGLPRFVGSREGIIDTASPALQRQMDDVIDSLAATGRSPAGVRQGGLRGRPGVYGNRGGELPQKPLGHYTKSDIWPGAGPRGTERIVRGDTGEAWDTPDHYGTFRFRRVR